MSDANAQEGLTLDTVLDDLGSIVQVALTRDSGSGASYAEMQQNLPHLHLHVLTYIRFLENHGYVEYDRVADVIRTSDRGRAAADDVQLWRTEAETAFAQHLVGNADADDDTMGELGAAVDDLIDSIAFDDVEEIGDEDDTQGVAVANYIQTPEPDAPVDQPEEPKNDDMNSNDGSSYQRRFSTGSHASARPASGTTPAATSSSSGGKMLYERDEEIGSGGMGTVYLGTQVKLNRKVAIKEIKEIFDVFAGVQRSDIVQRFTEIVQTQSQLIHPNIIQMIDIDTDARFPFVVMQYAPNGNLRRLIEMEGRPPMQVALKYFLQILHALSAAHDAKVTHGGIKPENVVLDASGNAMLTDFGISQVVELDSARANQVYVGVGTVAYMSPEQFRDPNASSVKSDIYSLGIMFYEMLTGKVPGRRSPMPSSFFPDIPRKLDDVFDRMSMDDEEDRYDSIDEVLADIYGDKDVMKILDKRGGFVFLRDPMDHGSVGLKVEIDDSSIDFDPSTLGEESSSLGEDSSDVEDDDDFEPEDGDVLDKLDKYGELFDEEGESDDDDDDDDAESGSEDDDSEASDDDESEEDDD